MAIKIVISSGQYHFVDEEGRHRTWDTRDGCEWWRKQVWLKEGGHNLEETAVKYVPIWRKKGE